MEKKSVNVSISGQRFRLTADGDVNSATDCMSTGGISAARSVKIDFLDEKNEIPDQQGDGAGHNSSAG